MEVNSNKISNQPILNEAKDENRQLLPDSVVSDSEELLYPDSGIMKAYANIKPREKTVSKDEALSFIRGTGCQFEQRCEQYVNNLTDSDGYIKQSTFDWAKRSYESSQRLHVVMSMIENSKENGKINQKMLDVLEPIMPDVKSLGSYESVNAGQLPNVFKDKEGKFNEDVLDIVKSVVDEVPILLFRRPEYIVYGLKDAKKDYDSASIDYYKQQKELGKSYKEIQENLAAGKNSEGVFSIDKLNFVQNLKAKGFEPWQINLIQKINEKLDDGAKQEFLEVADGLLKDRDLSEIFNDIESISSNEDDKTGITYNRKSIDFIEDLKKNAWGYQRSVPDILKKINIPIDDYTPENIKTIKSIFNHIRDVDDIMPLLDASVIKNGDNKGKFSFDNLERYLDIYYSNMCSIEEVKYISSILSKETDDRALETIRNLYNLQWETDKGFGAHTEMLHRRPLHVIFELSTLADNENNPGRQFYPGILDNFEKLMSMRLPMTSAAAFENFMTFGEFDVIEKLEKVGLDEIGIPTGHITHGKFKSASEEELLAFKDYMKEYLKGKDPKLVGVDLNSNIADVIEISDSPYSYQKKKIMYNIVKKRPVAEMSVTDGMYNYQKEQKDYEKNIVVKQISRKQEVNKEKYDVLSTQTVEKYDDDGNLLYTETMKQSDVNGVYNVQKTYPDGRVENIVKAQYLPNGNLLVEKNLVSSGGVKTIYRYEDDVNGNRIMDYKIVKPDGKVLMDRSVTFEVIDDNHYVTSANNKKFDVRVNTDTITVKNLNNGKTAEIDLKNFTESTQDKILPLLKRIPGEELFKMKEFDIKSIKAVDKGCNAAFSPKDENIEISNEFLDDGVLLHEWGHGKDHLEFKEISETISKDPKLKEIYEREKAAARSRMAEAELDHLSYFGADYHYLGSDKVKEGIAESNIVLNALPRHWVNAVRANYWMQEFPETIAYVSTLL
ncbi:MAG: hypothetical protein K6E29_07205 [Cyanobacteria bacterium RUI128]|nr:hypothetical protein [Cyanobacteria bacterium RUI128]